MPSGPISDRLLRDQIRAARLRARWLERHTPHASGVSVDRTARALTLSLTNGARITVPARLIPGLEQVPPAELAGVEVSPHGVGLRWPAFDLDLSVAGIVEACFGARALLKAAGAAGGSVRSAAKARAARLNGKRGGRPRKAAAAGRTRG